MQDLLTAAIQFTALSGFAYFSIAFISGYSRWKAAPAPVQPAMAAEDEAVCAVEPEPGKPIASDKVVPFTRKAPDLSGLSIRQLKAIASRTKLPKYNKDSKAVLQERLSALPAWALREAVAA
jgi:hypothetical protein